MMQNKMKELDLKEKSSKSLLANVLDMDDDFRPSSTLPHSHVHPHHPSHAQPQQNNGGFIRYFYYSYQWQIILNFKSWFNFDTIMIKVFVWVYPDVILEKCP